MNLIQALQNILDSEQSLNTTAYVNDIGEYTYKELFSRAEAVRVFLNHRNIKTPVIVYGHKQVELIAAFLACNAAGVPFVPVDVSIPADRLQNILTLSRAELILAAATLPEGNWPVADLLGLQPSTGGKFHLEDYITGEQISYIIFTSGSTGMPKGVQISAEALDDFLVWSSSILEGSEHFNFINHALFSFDLSIFEIWTSFIRKGKIIALDHKNNTNSRANFEFISKAEGNIWVSTPSFADLNLIDWKFSSKSIPSLTHFIFCGEVLAKSTVVKLKERFPMARIFNLYGPTEATCATTGTEVTAEMLAKSDLIPCGTVKNGTLIFIDKSQGKDEIVIVGKNVAHGYVNDPKRTKISFFKHEGCRAYRTGDYGYFDGDQLIVKGRIDRQIKFKGYRIELEEIETSVQKVFGGLVGVCLPLYKNEKVSELCMVLPKAGAPTHEEFIQKLSPVLPDYMIPGSIQILETLPLNNNGKIDRKEISRVIHHAREEE